MLISTFTFFRCTNLTEWHLCECVCVVCFIRLNYHADTLMRSHESVRSTSRISADSPLHFIKWCVLFKSVLFVARQVAALLNSKAAEGKGKKEKMACDFRLMMKYDLFV